MVESGVQVKVAGSALDSWLQLHPPIATNPDSAIQQQVKIFRTSQLKARNVFVLVWWQQILFMLRTTYADDLANTRKCANFEQFVQGS